ncbi:hypothetical protein DH2020_031069 [Rehmannia glutinosa]|uniref:C2H2-type domain-containing protein n=1 Tax=Rehmannia glutinosa TaxID=99300 RepID=A0ABR0VJ04_REHGL
MPHFQAISFKFNVVITLVAMMQESCLHCEEVSNGVSEINGVSENEALLTHEKEQKIEELDGVLENEDLLLTHGKEQETEELDGVLENEDLLLTNGKEQKIEELDGVLENASNPINGEQKSENLVFFDKLEVGEHILLFNLFLPGGIWKCRICTWTYRNGRSVCFDHIQNHKGQLHKLMNFKTNNLESEGVESTTTYFGENQIVKNPGPEKFDISSLDFVAQSNSTYAIKNGHEEDLENHCFAVASSNHQPSQISSHEDNTSYKPSTEIESAEVDVINGDDVEVTELDVERVIQKQTTHDLYCPNCNSCITKRVILRKRKRRIRISDEEIKRNKTESAVESLLGKGSVQSSRDQVLHTDVVDDNDTQIPLIDEDERERGPDIFRCLSCFSFFIPTGDGFKLFQIFGDKSGKEKLQDERAPSIKKNWFASIFASNKQEVPVEQGSSSQTDARKANIGVISSSNLSDQSGQPSFSQNAPSPAYASEGLVGTAGNNGIPKGRDEILSFPNQKPSLNGKLIIGAGDKLDMSTTETVDATMEQFDSYTEDQLKESKSNKEVHVNRETDLSVSTLPMRTQVTNGESVEDSISFSRQSGLKLLISSNKESQTLENSEEGQITTNQIMQSGDKDVIQLSSTSGSVLKASDVDGKLNISVSIPHEEQDVRATILTESVLENKNTNFSSIDSGHVFPTEVSQHIITKTKFEVHSGETLKVDNISVLKGVPVAQAGGGAATLNILALGVANLIGGLFILCNNLWELKSDRAIEQYANQVSHEVAEQRDRYKELLGRRQNFMLHAVVAIMSYLVFGLVPPVVYGFSFRKTDDKQFKLVVVAAASLLCIVVLAIGRAHVRRPPKPYLRSVITFVILGLMVSGVSYAAGELVERLLMELGLFEPSTPVSNLLVPEKMTPTGSAWASY